MLRKVLQSDQGVFDGTQSIIVGPATLEDAIQQGSVQISGNLLTRRFVAYSGKGQAIPLDAAKPFLPFSFEAVNAQGQKVRFTGSVSFGSTAGMNYNIALAIKYGKIWSFNFGATTDVKLAMDSITAEGDVAFDREFEAGRFFFEPVTIMMGPFPVVVAPELAVFVAAKGSAYAGMKTGLQEGAIVSVGASYANGQWTPSRKYSTSYSFSEPAVGGTAKFVVSVKPQLAFKFYGISGPITAMELNAIPAIDAAQNPWWKLYGELRDVLAVYTGAMGCSLGNQRWSLIDWSAMVSQATAFPGPTISGTVKTTAGIPLSGVTMTGLPGSPLTNTSGFYSAKVSWGWSGTVKPVKSGYTFTPATRTYAGVKASLGNQDYVAARSVTISGYVKTTAGIPVSGVQMRGLPGTPLTNASGYYIGTVPYGWSGTVTPYRPASDFGPRFRSYSGVTVNQVYQNYTMTQGTLPQ
jgi:hypothetical protein